MKYQLNALLASVLLVSACSGAGDVTVPDASSTGGFSGTESTLSGGFDVDGVNTTGAGTLPGTQISDMVNFELNQVTLTAESRQILDAQIGWLSQHSDQKILIEGHADERGTGEYNMALGSSRASAVRNYMVSQGIPDTRISIITYGRERPLATCAQETCWAQNRRAVTVVTGTLGS